MRRVVYVLSLLLLAAAGLLASDLRVDVIDVGQGDSILIEFPVGQTMLVDCGDQSHGHAVVAYLRSRAVKRIDVLVLTHPHADHIGGALAVIEAFPIGLVWESGFDGGTKLQQSVQAEIRRRGILEQVPPGGSCLKIGLVRVELLAPIRVMLSTKSDANNGSLVLLVRFGAIDILLTGDMEATERATVATWPRCAVLKVSHHGSRTGTDRAFVGAIAPKIAVISVGDPNYYGHPHASVIAALTTGGADVLKTSTSGTVVLTTDGHLITCDKSVSVR